MKIQICPYGRASSTLEALVDQGRLERRCIAPLQLRALGTVRENLLHLWIAFSPEVDKEFVHLFHQHSTPETRLLIMNERPSSDTIFTRLLDLRIRSPKRLYVADYFGTGKSNYLGALLQRLTSALKAGDYADRILDARIEDSILRVVSPEFKRLDVPIAAIPSLAGKDSTTLDEFEIDEDGSFIYWPNSDVHVGWEQLRQIADPQAARKALHKCQQFNVRYGKAVRKVREGAELKPSDIMGLSQKQLGRIEQGECRLTSHALESLSRSHGLKPNEYLEKLAKVLTT